MLVFNIKQVNFYNDFWINGKHYINFMGVDYSVTMYV
jgi:hypothetical protein